MRAISSPRLSVAFLVLSFLVSLGAAAAPTFGPKQYLRVAGAPQTFTDTFAQCGGGTCQLVVLNGNPDGSARVSAGSVWLNGVPLVRERDLNQRVDRIVVPVTLEEADQIRVVLKSAPGSFLTISVECSRVPGAAHRGGRNRHLAVGERHGLAVHPAAQRWARQRDGHRDHEHYGRRGGLYRPHAVLVRGRHDRRAAIRNPRGAL